MTKEEVTRLQCSVATGNRVWIECSDSASDWIKDALAKLDARDVCDVLKDLDALASIFEAKAANLEADMLAREALEADDIVLVPRGQLDAVLSKVGDYMAGGAGPYKATVRKA